MRVRTIIVAAGLLSLAGWALVAQRSKSAAVPPGEFTNSIGMKFVRVDPGSLKMDSASGVVHEVTLSKRFYMQTTEVTQAQWQAVMGTNPSSFEGPDRPVEMVSWNDAQEFLERLNAKEKESGYRLPSGAEWTYACRAGGLEPDMAPNLGEVAWWRENSGKETHPVGQKKPNAWGLYDMRGNVSEWVQDLLAPTASKARGHGGGSWYFGRPDDVRCAVGSGNEPDYRFLDIGFRCVRADKAE